MKPYEEVCFPSGIIRWVRENNLYVCRLTEDQMNEIKQIHETPYTKTYSGGTPNYTQPIEREPMIDDWPLYSGLPQPKPEQINYEEWNYNPMTGEPLYTAPPQREWVGLTKNEFSEILCDDRWQSRPELMLLEAQAKLKEKNA